MGILHVLVNALYVTIGIVAGHVLAWLLRVERRRVIRIRFVLIVALCAFALGWAITLLTPDSIHLGGGIAVGIPAGFLVSLGSRMRSKPAPGGARSPGPRR